MTPPTNTLYKMMLLALIFSLAPASPSQAQDSNGRIGIRFVDVTDTEFYNIFTEEPFVPLGVNYTRFVETEAGLRDHVLAPDVFDEAQVRADFQALAAAGLNTVRLTLDGCECIGAESGRGLNPAYMDNLAQTMTIAAENGLFLILASQGLPERGGYQALSNQGAGSSFAAFRNAHFLTGSGHIAAEAYWRDILNALSERNVSFETVLGWSIVSQVRFDADAAPFDQSSGIVSAANGARYDLSNPAAREDMLVDNLIEYARRLRGVIRETDSLALVTMGLAGDDLLDDAFLAPPIPPLLADAPLDFIDLHADPDPGQSMAAYAEAYGTIDYMKKPIIMGQVGAPRSTYESIEEAARATQLWIAESCQYSWDGWVYWSMYAPEDAAASADRLVTWDFQAADGAMLQALSPLNSPDPCDPRLLYTDNLALNAPVAASSAATDQPPELAVDNDEDTTWQATGRPVQFLTVQFEAPASIREVQLLVAQETPGETLHQVWAVQDGRNVLVYQFQGETEDGQVLTYALPTTLHNVSELRIETQESANIVAWHEVYIFEGDTDDPAACVVSTRNNTNLREAPNTNTARAGVLGAGRGALADAQITGDDGFVWWRLTHGVWVRSDVVQASETCETLPAFEEATDSSG